ncbi:MAG: restriction endonuclease [Candidatus Acidiferrales bacterium]
MAEITRKRVGELQRGVFKILLNHPEGLPAKELLEQLEKTVPPTDFERSDYPNRPGVRRFEKIVRFATIAPVKAGWLIKSRGRWTLTDEGREAYQKFQDPEKFVKEGGRLYKQWAASQPDAIEEVSEDEPAATGTFEEAEEAAWAEIQQHLKEMNPYDFQKLVAALLSAMGYHVSWIAPPGPDKGIDILAHTDPLGTSVPRIKVQVKRRDDTIKVDGLRSFMAVLGDQDVGIFVSTGGFTRDAESEARIQEKRKVTLIDLERLFELWVQHYDKIAESAKRLLPLKPVYYLAPAE